jgi:hypothetical protein
MRFLALLEYQLTNERHELRKNLFAHLFVKFYRSRRALAIPMTFMILFVSTLGLISITYYFAVERVNAQTQTLKVVAAKEDIVTLDQNILSVVGQPGSARALEILDSGGKLNVEPNNGSSIITINDNKDINQTIYNQTTGQIRYELPYSDSPDTGLFLKGDSRTITNQSGSLITQLFIASGAEHAEIRLRYRPTVSYITAGIENNLTINNVRIYIVNMNSSNSISLNGKVPLRISCESTQITSLSYTLNYITDSLVFTSILDDTTGQVSIPISSTIDGAIINLEIVQCNIKVARSLV